MFGKKKDSKQVEEKEDKEETQTHDDEFNIADVLKDLLATKTCQYCSAVIPSTCATCFSCHSVQPLDTVPMDVTDYAPHKSGKGFTMKRQLVYDPADPNRGVVWKNVVYKVVQNPLQYLCQGAGVACSFGGLSSKKKKDRKVYVDGLQLITNFGKLQQMSQNYTSANGGDIVDAFLNSLKSVREEMLKDAKKLVASGDIVYEALWFLFERGTPIYYHDADMGCIFGTIITNWNYVSGFGDSFVINGTVMKSDGQSFYQEPINTAIPGFEGIVKIDLLPVQKLSRSMHSTLTERGKLFAQVAIGAHFKQYRGTLLTPTVFGYMKFRADGRVMVDTATFNRMNPSNTKFVSPNQNLQLQQQANNANRNRTIASSVKDLKEAQYWMTYPTLPGFSLMLKKWGEFLINGLSDIEFDDLSFVQLVLPEDKKKMIKALVEEHQRSGIGGEAYKLNSLKQAEGTKGKEIIEQIKQHDINHMHKQPDLIKCKGGGCIFLLHGSPGVGKTLTAEAVSEHLHIPLYQVTVGELGTEPAQLEKSLGNLLELAALWNASILLDEADIFLERRSRNDILRNAMVGIFLRLLEYHQGVLFLTTNRVDCMDEAFSSRISVALYYPPLDKSARGEVWKNFLVASPHRNKDYVAKKSSKKGKSKSSSSTKSEYDIESLAAYELNGRQIRSCVQMARALANSESKLLSQKHLVQTIELSLDFAKQFEHSKPTNDVITENGNETEEK